MDLNQNKGILVIGDIMLDKYMYGYTERISPEAPVPIVRIHSEKNILGGASNVANNIVSLGSRAYMAGILGEDKAAKTVLKLLKNKGIDTSLILVDNFRPTTVKQRIISGNQHQVLRMDFEKTAKLEDKFAKRLFLLIKNKIKEVDAVIISDYNKGVLTEKLAKSIIKLAKDNEIPVIVDCKPCNKDWFKGCTIITPNLKEAIEMTNEKELDKIGKKLVKEIDTNVFITRGAEGISVFDKKGKHTYVPQIKIAKVFDVTGAGDTVVAITALSYVSGHNLVKCAEIANYGGGLVVQKPGTSTVTIEELENVRKQEISHYLQESIEVKQKVIDKQIDRIEGAAKILVNAYKKGNKVIAFGNGGSASDAQHLVGELVGRFKIERKGLPAMSLTTDSSVVTAIANDYGYDKVFERQVEANAIKGDVVFGISTSGNSPNVINAINKAKEIGCKTIGLTGKEGGKLAKICDEAIVVPSNNTPRIQEAHIAIIHIICEILDTELSKNA